MRAPDTSSHGLPRSSRPSPREAVALAERTPHATWASSGAGDEAHAAVGQKYALLLLCFKVRHVFSGRVKGKGKARNRSAPRTSLQHLPGPWAPSSPLASLRGPPVFTPRISSAATPRPRSAGTRRWGRRSLRAPELLLWGRGGQRPGRQPTLPPNDLTARPSGHRKPRPSHLWLVSPHSPSGHSQGGPSGPPSGIT